MGNDKSLMNRTTAAVTSAAQTVTDGLKSAGKAVAKAITPKPIKAGDKVIIPSVDPSMPPIVVPAKKRARRSTTGRKTSARRGRKPANTSRVAKTRGAAAKGTARGPARKKKSTAKRTTARRNRS